MQTIYEKEIAEGINHDMSPKLHELMDEDVGDVYAENERFHGLLSSFYLGNHHNSECLKEMNLIIFRCASNILKKRFGFYHSWQWIATKAIEITEIISGRIVNGLRNNGKEYKILNLPTTVKYAMLNVVYNNPKRMNKEYVVDDTVLNIEIEKQNVSENNWEDIICICVDNGLDTEEYL